MLIDGGMIISGFVSKVVSDCVDVLKEKIKDADRNRKANEQNMETRIYQVTVDALNNFLNDKYKGQDTLYDAAESILNGLKNSKEDKIDAVRAGLKMLGLQVMGTTCEGFLLSLCYEICKKENRDLAIEAIILQQELINGYIQEGFRKSYLNYEEINQKLDYLIKELAYKKVYEKPNNNENHIENRAEEYAQKWDKNVFLNNFNERDENAGTNIKLREIYLDEHLPHYIWKANKKPRNDLKDLLKEYIVASNDKRMLLILGQAGIGKSTLITWILSNFVEQKDQILVYQFASDLKNINWKEDNILNEIIKTIGLERTELEGKTLILDGFDEIYANGDRERILNQSYRKLKEMNYLKNFLLIMTCRTNYVDRLNILECDHITLQTWDNKQIQSFCRTYGNINKSNIDKNTLSRISENKEVFGIPLILYMVMSLNISITESASIVDVYDRIYSLDEGGIYDRCIKNSSYAPPHRIASIKQQIHQVSQRIAFWIFENNSEKAFITKTEFENICDIVMSETKEKSEDLPRDVLIGSYFKPIKHCEGIGTDELEFVHRSLYEYFVAVYFFESIYSQTSKVDVAGKLGFLLKSGQLSGQILEFIKNKFDSIKKYNLPNITKEIFNIMLRDGMTYHAKENYKNAIEREMSIFFNMLNIMHIWNSMLGEFDRDFIFYLHYNNYSGLNLKGLKLRDADLFCVYLGGAKLNNADIEKSYLNDAYLVGADLSEANLCGVNLNRTHLGGANLSGADLRGVDFRGAYLFGADLSRADIRGADLRGVDLSGTSLREADLSGADFRGAKLSRADFRGAAVRRTDLRGAVLEKTDFREVDLYTATLSNVISGAILDEKQIDLLKVKHGLNCCEVCLSKTGPIISYEEYCGRKSNM